MEEIVIRISSDGKINLNVNGVKGSACKDLTKSLEKSLGTILETQNTGEYYEQEVEVTKNQTLGGKNW